MYLILLSLATLGACMDYSDHLGRSISFPLSAAMYSQQPSSCLQEKFGISTLKEYSVKLGGGSCSGLIVNLPAINATALVFRAELAKPSKFVEKWFELFVPFTTWRHGGKVSKFLEKAFRKLWLKGGMKRDFKEIMKQRGNDEVLVTGYSLGGGVASLVAVDIVKDGLVDGNKVTLITLGQPMVGDQDFATEYEQEVEQSFRVVRVGDSLPHSPGEDRGYQYNGREVFYSDSGMPRNGFKICKNVTEDGCSGSQTSPIRLRGNDDYFGKNVRDYGEKCVRVRYASWFHTSPTSKDHPGAEAGKDAKNHSHTVSGLD
ncbi:hypothetical protein Y032_0118g772 [Ancylostoma ceylanicum]|nr:hypothetical protein Y032_0118g772 [Ancylostoma ceylanicum]